MISRVAVTDVHHFHADKYKANRTSLQMKMHATTTPRNDITTKPDFRSQQICTWRSSNPSAHPDWVRSGRNLRYRRYKSINLSVHVLVFIGASLWAVRVWGRVRRGRFSHSRRRHGRVFSRCRFGPGRWSRIATCCGGRRGGRRRRGRSYFEGRRHAGAHIVEKKICCESLVLVTRQIRL